MKRTPVSSSAVRSVGYDRASATLEIEFVSGDLYEYFMVPAHVFSGLLAADSKGTYVRERITDRFPFRRTNAPITG